MAAPLRDGAPITAPSPVGDSRWTFLEPDAEGAHPSTFGLVNALSSHAEMTFSWWTALR